MFKKLRGLFSLEQRIMDGVAQNLHQNAIIFQKKLEVLELEIKAKSQQIDKLEAVLSKRLSFIEYHFSNELAEKEKARELAVKEIRLGHKG